jgi:putative tryptophan/tyrosine transport system substrate-binding protein
MRAVDFAMGIRMVIAVCALVCGTPLAIDAQDAPHRYRIGVLDVATLEANEANLSAFRHGLREFGYVEGQNLVIEYRSAEGRPQRLPELAAELVQLNLDVLVTRGTPAALVARHVTATVPIVMAASGDPVYAGLVASLPRPGGNVTGLHVIAPSHLAGTRLRLLKELVPGVSRVAVLLDSGDVYALAMRRELETVARTLGIQVHVVDTRRPADLERAFEAALLDRVDAVVPLEGVLTTGDLTRIVGFATMSRLPAIYGLREFAEAGGLMAYGTDVRDLFRRSATYVHRILAGAKPADLAVEGPAKFELVINLTTARALGLIVPPSLLRRADHVIQ